MGYISFNLQLHAKTILVIGGGAVAERKVTTILAAEAKLTVISPTLTYSLQQLRDSGKIRCLPRKYQPGDLDGAFMVIAATSDRAVNAAIAAEAATLGILAEVVDNPAAGTVTSPALIRQGDLSIAISTNNRAPALAAAIKRELTPVFGPEYAKSVRLLGLIREKLLTAGGPSPYNKQILGDLSARLPALFAAGAEGEIDQLLQNLLGAEWCLASFDLSTGENQ